MSTDLKACVADEETTRALVTAAMREDGFLPEPLPQWRPCEPLPQPKPPPYREQMELTPTVAVTIEHSNDGYGCLRVWQGGYARDGWLRDVSIEVRRAAFLRFALAEVEKTLPILRRLVEAENAESKQ